MLTENVLSCYPFHDINSVQKLISNHVIEFYCMQPHLYSTLRVMLIVKFILLFVIQ